MSDCPKMKPAPVTDNATLLVEIGYSTHLDFDGVEVRLRTVIDSGSGISLIKEQFQ